MKLELSLALVVALTIVPAILVFLASQLKIKQLTHQKKSLETDALQHHTTILDLEKEIVTIREKNQLNEDGIFQINNTKNNTKAK